MSVYEYSVYIHTGSLIYPYQLLFIKQTTLIVRAVGGAGAGKIFQNYKL